MDCERCKKLEVKLNPENAYKIRAARDAATSRQGLERLAMENKSMLKNALFDIATSRKEVDRLAKLCAELGSENMHLKNVLKEIQMSFDRANM